MGVDYKPAGKAVAIAKGHYPLRDGRHVTVAQGQTFEVFEGLTKGSWFKLLPADTPAPVPVALAAPAEHETLAGAAAAERKRKGAVKPPTADDLV